MKRARGFTLVELIVAIVLMGILAVALFPRGSSPDALSLRGRAEQLASDIRYVQTLSMTRGSAVTGGRRFCLTLSASDYQLNTTNVANTCTATIEPHPGGLNQPVPLCIACMSWTANLSPANNIQFDGRGQPFSGGPPVALAADAVITLTDGGVTNTVTISPNTGRVIVQ